MGIGEAVGGRRSCTMGSEIRTDATDMVSRGRSRAMWLRSALSSQPDAVDRRRGGRVMVDVLQSGMRLMRLGVRLRDHGGPSGRRFIGGGRVVILLLIIVALPGEVFRTFVFMGRAAHLIAVCGLAHVIGGVLEELFIVAEDDDGDINRAEDGEFMGFFEEAAFSFDEGSIWLA